MKTSKTTRTVTIFVALCIVGICMVVLSSGIPEAERALSLVGSALFGSGLTFLLVKLV